MGTIIERKGKKGTSYRAQIRRHGRFLKHQSDSLSKTFKTYREASEWIKKTESSINENEPRPFVSKQNIMPHELTFEWLVADYQREVQSYKQKATTASQKFIIQFWEERFGKLPVRIISPTMINDGILEILHELKPSSVLKYMTVLNCIMKYAMNRGCIQENPVT